MEIKSLTENINRSRQEIENKNKRIDEFNQQISNMQKEKDDLRGDVAGDANFIFHLIETLKDIESW